MLKASRRVHGRGAYCGRLTETGILSCRAATSNVRNAFKEALLGRFTVSFSQSMRQKWSFDHHPPLADSDYLSNHENITLQPDHFYRLAAFADIASDSASTGNPAGVWIGDCLPEAATMQRIAADIGYSETAFLAPSSGFKRQIRYFSPLAEVPFCGHATIAAAATLGKLTGEGIYTLHASVGDIPVTVSKTTDGYEATLVSVATTHQAVEDVLMDRALEILGWSSDDMDPAIPPAKAFAGAWHLVIAARQPTRLASLSYDFDALKSLMLEYNLTTLQLVWRESDDVFHSRNPFPVGGVVEDPATGAAAAAFGGYLRDAGLIQPPGQITIHQGVTMGSPSIIKVYIPATGGIHVTGATLEIIV